MRVLMVTVLAVASTLSAGQAVAPKLDAATQAQVSQIVANDHAIIEKMNALEQQHQANIAQIRILQVQVSQKYPGYHLDWQHETLEKNQ